LIVLLLNPPGKRQFLRDYYCSTVSKAGYRWHPIDLLVQSGFLARQASLFFIDAIAQRLTSRQTLDRIRQIQPDVIFSLIGVQSFVDDLEFLREAAECSRARIAVSGEPVLGKHEQLLQSKPWVSAVIQNFTTGQLEDWIKEGAPRKPQVVLGNRWNVPTQGDSRDSSRTFSYPLPRHSLFLSQKYRVPFDGGKLYASLLSSFGCPFRCSYCNSGMNSIGFAYREKDELFDEIEMLQRTGKVGHLFFRDMSFTASRERTLEICERILSEGYKFSWNCYSRPESLDVELCVLMAKAGCKLVQIGVETFNEETLRLHGRKMSETRIDKAFEIVRQSGMRSGAHFLMGLPGESFESMQATVERAIDISPDYVSFNILQRRLGSELSLDEHLSARNLHRLQRLRRRAYRKYYLRVRYLLDIFSEVKSPQEFMVLAKSAAALAWTSIVGEEKHGQD